MTFIFLKYCFPRRVTSYEVYSPQRIYFTSVRASVQSLILSGSVFLTGKGLLLFTLYIENNMLVSFNIKFIR